MIRQLISFFTALLLAFPGLAAALFPEKEGAEATSEAVYTGLDYNSPASWSIRQSGRGRADVFILAPTVDYGLTGEMNMSLENMLTRLRFDGTARAQADIYAGGCNVYAPYYRQATMLAYDQSEAVRERALERAYEDVSAAFRWYLDQRAEGRPIILAGFSQGGDMVARLIREYFGDEELRAHLAAAYVIGWAITEEDVAQCSWLNMAQGETDTGVVVSFECEAEGMTSSRIVEEGVKMLSINPLSWTTDSEYASAGLNSGACFLGMGGRIVSTRENLTGAYIDPERGTLVCTDIDPRTYISGWGFAPGEYHYYDYQFFYRNLQENAQIRLNAWFQARNGGQSAWEYVLLAIPAMGLAAIPPAVLRRKKRLPALAAQ